MKDEHDTHRIDLIEGATSGGVAESVKLPAGSKHLMMPTGVVHLVPVSFVAKDWKVSSRRIRALLSGGRLWGSQQQNGYWEVFYPYTFTEGRRGPQMRRREVKSPPQKVELRAV
jgi:hypothetical protein